MVAITVDKIEESYDLSTMYYTALVQGQDGFKVFLRNIMQRNLFPGIKILNNASELMYHEHSFSTSIFCNEVKASYILQKIFHSTKILLYI